MMDEFDRRWQSAAAEARKVRPREPSESPFGFTTRVVTQWESQPAAGARASALWESLSLRVLGAVALLLLLLLALGGTPGGDGDLRPPAVENTISDLFWML